jgi:hypothetical protein
MSVYFHSNLESGLDEAIETKLEETLHKREGKWVVTLKDKPGMNAWDVSIDGPNGFKWAKRFTGAERDVDLAVSCIRRALDLPQFDLNGALAELAIEGVAFTSETAPGGGTIHLIDQIRLREDEVLALKNRGALTRNGIRQYLVDRAA